MYSSVAFKYVNLIPCERNIHFRENWLILLGIWREAELIKRICRAKVKYVQGAEEFSFRHLGTSLHYV